MTNWERAALGMLLLAVLAAGVAIAALLFK